MNAITPEHNHADDPERFKRLIQRPQIAWPTLMLLLAAFTTFTLSTLAYVQGILPLGWVMFFNAVASYMSFTVAHDATHSAVLSHRKANDWVGRLAMFLLELGPFFQVFRVMHMKHHRFTNDAEKDPDAYCGSGPTWALPLRWLSLGYAYFKTYLSPDVFKKRPKNERREFYFALAFAVGMIIAMTLTGWLQYYLLLFFIPTRIAKLVIVFAFDFLPHHPHEVTAKEAPYQCTSNRVGMERFLTPLFIYQNYHLVHHLYPAIPFYRYLKVWNARKTFHLAQTPAITPTFALRPRVSEE